MVHRMEVVNFTVCKVACTVCCVKGLWERSLESWDWWWSLSSVTRLVSSEALLHFCDSCHIWLSRDHCVSPDPCNDCVMTADLVTRVMMKRKKKGTTVQALACCIIMFISVCVFVGVLV